MAMLRSCKFFTQISNCSRYAFLKTSTVSEIRTNVAISQYLTRSYASVAQSAENNLARSLRKVRGIAETRGRITRRDVEDIFVSIKNQSTATSTQALEAIRYCGNVVADEPPQKRNELLKKIWKTLNNANVPLDISHYNALTHVYLENDYKFSPKDILNDLEQKGIEPNRVTYQNLISYYCRQGDIEGAISILELMRNKEIPLNTAIFNDLILGHVLSGDFVSATNMITTMKQNGLKPNSQTFRNLLKGYAKIGDVSSINQTLSRFEEEHIPLGNRDILEVIYELTAHGHSNLIDSFTERLHKSLDYRHSVRNAIPRFVAIKEENVVFQILKSPTTSNEDFVQLGKYFFKELVKSKRPTESVINIWNELKEKGINVQDNLDIYEIGLKSESTDLIHSILNELKSASVPIVEEYFYNLLRLESAKGTDNALNAIKLMQEEFNVEPRFIIIRDCILPGLNASNPNVALAKLRTTNIKMHVAVSAVVCRSLLDGKLKDAYEIARQHKINFFNPKIFTTPLLNAFVRTGDVQNFVNFIRIIHDSIPHFDKVMNQENIENGEESNGAVSDVQDKQAETVGKIVYAAFVNVRNTKTLTKILKTLKREGLSISNNQADRISERLGSELTDEISNLLTKLSTGDLQPKPLVKVNPTNELKYLTSDELEKMIALEESKGKNTTGYKVTLLTVCMNENNIEKFEKLLNQLETENITFTKPIYAEIIQFYTSNDNIEKALDIYKKVRAQDPEFTLDKLKVAKIITNLFTKNYDVNEIDKFLVENKTNESIKRNEDEIFLPLLNSIAETGKVDVLNSVFNKLLEYNYIKISNKLLGPLIKVHCTNNDLNQAINKFEEFVKEHQKAPMRMFLINKLIQAEDIDNLQRVFDLSTSVYGEHTSLYSLAFGFIECNRISQAKSILETEGLHKTAHTIKTRCERYYRNGLVEPLKNLLEATKGLDNFDRENIFYYVLLSYCRDDLPQEALELWTQMQEEDVTPSDEFLNKLGSFLEGKGLEVPFVIPKQIQQSQSSVKKPANESDTIQISESLRKFRSLLNGNDTNQMYSAWKQLEPSDQVNVRLYSRFISKLLQNEQLDAAVEVTKKLLSENLHPFPRVLESILRKLVNSNNNLEVLKYFEERLNSDVQKACDFQKYYLLAHVNTNRLDEYLQEFSDAIDSAKTDDELKELNNRFLSFTIFDLIKEQQQHLPKLEEIANKFAAKNIFKPMNVVWLLHFINDNQEVSKSIWTEHLSSSTKPGFMDRFAIRKLYQLKSENHLKQLIDLLAEGTFSNSSFKSAYHSLLSIYIDTERFDEGLQLLEATVQKLPVENQSPKILIRLKTGLESSGKQFPYTIPEKTAENKEENKTDDLN